MPCQPTTFEIADKMSATEPLTDSREDAAKLTLESMTLSGGAFTSRASRFSNQALLRDLATRRCGVSSPETTNGGTGRRKSLNHNLLNRDGGI